MSHIIVLDTETSDLDPAQGAKLLEIAWIELSWNNEFWEPTFSVEARIQYQGPISPHAQAVHHIRSDELTEANGAVPHHDAVQLLRDRIRPDTILAAHNSAFDSKFLPEIHNPWICTMRSARHIWPNAPGYSNQVLRYWMNLEVDIPPGKYPHQAIYDVTVTTGILQRMLKTGYTTEQLLHFTGAPLRLKTINFGKHKGMEFSQIPRDYLQWLRAQGNIDPDLRHTIDSILKP